MKRSKDRFSDRVAPKRQVNWDWRAAANFIAGGAGSGLLVFAALTALDGGDLRAAVFMAMALVGFGLTCVWFEIGRPWRALNVYRHVGSSWMTREAVVALFLFFFGGLAVLTGHLLAYVLAGISGAAFLYSQARILQADKGIPTWRHPRSLPLMVSTGLVEGVALLMLLAPTLASAKLGWIAGGLLLTLMARFMTWKSYLAGLTQGGAPARALAVLRGFDSRFIIFGHVLPATGVLVTLLSGSVLGMVVGGVFALGAGVWLKAILILKAAFTQGFALPKLPVRGRGPSGPAAKPGWA